MESTGLNLTLMLMRHLLGSIGLSGIIVGLIATLNHVYSWLEISAHLVKMPVIQQAASLMVSYVNFC